MDYTTAAGFYTRIKAPQW